MSHIQIAMCFGGMRIGPTREHEKLINTLLTIDSDKYYVYVTGPETEDKTSAKEPLTAQDKLDILQKLYPKNKEIFRIGKTPIDTMKRLWREFKDEYNTIGLTIIAGSGTAGIGIKDKHASRTTGGPAEHYKKLFEQYNGTISPIRIDKNGNEYGGLLRMNYSTLQIIENPRGEISGSLVRMEMRNCDSGNVEQFQRIKSYMHSGFSDSDILRIIEKIKKY